SEAPRPSRHHPTFAHVFGMAIVHSKPMASPSASETAARSPRALLAAEKVGVLSTISVHRAGFPYGSVTPYALSAQGAPVRLLSLLRARHKDPGGHPRA